MRKRILEIRSLIMPANFSSSFVPVVEVANQYPTLVFDSIKLQTFFTVVFSVHKHNFNGELSIAFMKRENHSLLHGKYLQDFRPTDVITFPGCPEDDLIGEICVCVDQALEEASKNNLTFHEELSLYLIHGWLHLLGFDDCEKIDREVMRNEEQRVMYEVKKLNAYPDFRLAQDAG